MIRALIDGKLLANPQPRTSTNGNRFALARLSLKQDDSWVTCSIIAFDAAAARLLELKAGASVSMAGALKVGTWQANDGTTRPSLELVADEVASATPRPRRSRRDRVGTADADAGGSYAHE
jgi:single-stranded DNA-binding protein